MPERLLLGLGLMKVDLSWHWGSPSISFSLPKAVRAQMPLRDRRQSDNGGRGGWFRQLT
jgi:hypothetical protein